jgi:membrane-bound inhibitor of C-type lysozyme
MNSKVTHILKAISICIPVLLIVFAVCASGREQHERIGGDRDEHGCIGPAGYVWCESKQRCIRPWEEDCASLPPVTAVYDCRSLGEIVVEYRRFEATLSKGGEDKYELDRVISASGAKYEGDGAMIWDDSGNATLRLEGEEYECSLKSRSTE